MRIHTGEKTYTCEICQISFTHKNQLSRHEKSSSHLQIEKTFNPIDYIGSGEAIKVDNIITEEINEEESVENAFCSDILDVIKAEDVKEENNEERGVEHSPSTQLENIHGLNRIIKQDIKEEGSDYLTSMKKEIIKGHSDVKEKIKEEGIDEYHPSIKLENIEGYTDVKEEIKEGAIVDDRIYR